MHSHKSIIERLHNSPKFKLALSMCRDEKEREKITRIAESFAGAIADMVVPAIEQSQKDPTFVSKLGQALVEKHRVVTSNGPVSGSTG